MFEVIISTVASGRVQRKCFDTRDQATRYVDQRLDQWSEDGRSAREFRIEIHARELPPVRPLRPRRRPKATAA